MTTQWNSPQAGDADHGEPRAEGEERESGPAASGPWNDEPARGHASPAPSGGPASYESSPWRGYTMPVPEHPEHAEERERAAEEPLAHEPPAYDGIAGYPDPSGAGAAQNAPQQAPEAVTDASARPESQAESAEAAKARQRRFGRHARAWADAEGERRRQGHTAQEDDPDGLAGWVGSLTEAADDTRIAGRSTGSFPVVTPETERPAERAADPAAEQPVQSAPEAPEAEEAPRRHTRRPAPGATRTRATATWVPSPEQDERDGETVGERAPEAAPEPERTEATGPADPVAGTGAGGPHVTTDDDPPPLPRRVPGPSAVSGAFRAVGTETSAPGTETAPGTEPGAAPERDARSAYEREDIASEEPEEEYRPTTHDHWQPTSTTSRAELIERLDALSTLAELGRDDLPEEVLGRAGQLLDHAGARLRLSGEHTVVALAGGTGSGKSSLFNALCGLELSQTGVTRPTTSKAHACVWGHEGADALLSWLGVPTRYRHSRTSVLDSGNSELTGLVLLDLPDHDSVRSMHTAEADRLIGSVDLLVWVLDPQKYADAAVHHRYLAKMAGHGAVTVAVLNQVDKVASDELEELLTDLRRLLESESGVHPRVITTSTVTGQGVRDVRDFLSETVTERHALVDRLVADLDQVIVPFEEFYGDREVPGTVSVQTRSRVREGLANAAGVTAVADVVETNDVRRGKRRVGWPVARYVAKLRKDPLATVQLDFLRRDEPGVGGRVDAHEAELETALGEAADEVSEGMPGPWRRRMRAAARSGAAELPAELGEAVAGAVGDPDRSPSWWRLARTVQYSLLSVAGVGFAWALLSLLSWLGGGITGLRMFDDPIFIAYSGAVVGAGLLVGWLTGVGCGNLVEVAAVQRRENVERAAQERVREIAGLRVVAPMEEELARYRAFRAAYEVARIRD
ncbi:GTPase [Nocardiopsis terrae]